MMRQVYQFDCGGRVEAIKFSRDGARVAALVDEQLIHVWNASTYSRLGTIVVTDWVRDFCLFPDEEILAVVTAAIPRGQPVARTTRLTIYQIRTGQALSERTGPDVRSITYCDANGLLATGVISWQGKSAPHLVELHDLRHRRRAALSLPTSDLPASLVYGASGNVLATVGVGATLWNLTTGELLWDLGADLDSGQVDTAGVDVWEAMNLALSGDGVLLAIGFWGADGGSTEKVCLYHIPSRTVMGWRCRGFRAVNSLALSPDGRWLAATGPRSGEDDHESELARIWDTVTGVMLDECTLPGLSSVSFDPERPYLLTGARAPESVTVWSLEDEAG
jgi:WD40 repeat protein